MDHETARSKVERQFRKTAASETAGSDATFLIDAEERDIHWQLGDSGEDGDPDQRYHAASVGKSFTATIIGMLHDQGELSLDDPIASHLSTEIMDGLHIYRGTDYGADINIHHLLGHTSGLPHLLSDEFGLLTRRKERSPAGKTFLDVQLEDPDRFWEAKETIEWAKTNLHPHFRPGDGIFYSEVGYNLLGLIIESVSGTPYPEALHEYLFDPLSMDRSSLLHFTTPATGSDQSPSHIYFDGTEIDVEEFRSLSGWFAGGNTVNTTSDLLRFHRALVAGDLVSPATLDEMHNWRRISLGVDYGYGLARFRPLPLRQKYHVWGGIGATNSLMFYNPAVDAYFIGTFNTTAGRSRAYRFVFNALRTVTKVPPVSEAQSSANPA